MLLSYSCSVLYCKSKVTQSFGTRKSFVRFICFIINVLYRIQTTGFRGYFHLPAHSSNSSFPHFKGIGGRLCADLPIAPCSVAVDVFVTDVVLPFPQVGGERLVEPRAIVGTLLRTCSGVRSVRRRAGCRARPTQPLFPAWRSIRSGSHPTYRDHRPAIHKHS